jgi:acetyl-CoA acetyltransferase
VGTGFSKISRYAEKPIGALAVEACQKALAEAGVDAADVDGLSTYPNQPGLNRWPIDGQDVLNLDFVAKAFPFKQLTWTSAITQGTVAAATAHATNAIAAGACDRVLVWRAMHNPRGRYGVADVVTASGSSQFSAPYGQITTIQRFAIAYAEYLHRWGLTKEDMAHFVVANRLNASRNPEAIFWNKPITIDDYLGSPVVSTPMNYLDCDMLVDGCGALLLCRADLAADGPSTPAYIAGAVAAGIGRKHEPAWMLDTFLSSAASLAEALWRKTGLTPSDIQHVNLYDGFSYFVPLYLEAFGFCGPGEATAWIREHDTSTAGDFPLNTSGGSLGMGRLHGTPLLIEAVRQVQGNCGDRQTRGVTHALAQAGSALLGAGAVIFAKDPVD